MKKTISYAIFVLAWTILGMVTAEFIVAYPMTWLLGENISLPFWTFVYYVLTYGLTLVFVILLPPKIYKAYLARRQQSLPKKSNPLASNAKSLGLDKWPTFVDLGLAPIGYIVYIFIANLLTRLMTIFPWYDSDQSQDVGFSFLTGGWSRYLAIISVVFIAPIVEEIVMRGWLYGKLREKLKAPIAILLVSIVFGLLHGQWNVGVTVFVLSLVLCTLREITGTIWSGMLLHILSNGIAFYLLYNLAL